MTFSTVRSIYRRERFSAVQPKTALMLINLLLLFFAVPAFSQGNAGADSRETANQAMPLSGSEQTAVFAGGCFWGMEGVFERIKGVKDVVSGYSGGSAATATYRQVGSGKTGHAESVRILYDPAVVSFDFLLEVFFNVAHDPTELNFQGPDVGTQYRSAVFYTDDEQQQETTRYIQTLNASGKYKSPIVTEVTPFKAFYPAEDYHQDFMRNNPGYPYIVYWDLPKVRLLESEYPDKLKS